MATRTFQLTDELWALMEPLIPKHKNTHCYGGGRPRVSDRQCMHGILHVLTTGCQWKALDATDICSGSTAHRRFQAWIRAGVFQRFHHAGLLRYDALKGIDWSFLSMDGALTKAPLGGGKNRAQPHRPRQTRHEAQPADRRARRAPGGGRRGRQRQ